MLINPKGSPLYIFRHYDTFKIFIFRFFFENFLMSPKGFFNFFDLLQQTGFSKSPKGPPSYNFKNLLKNFPSWNYFTGVRWSFMWTKKFLQNVNILSHEPNSFFASNLQSFIYLQRMWTYKSDINFLKHVLSNFEVQEFSRLKRINNKIRKIEQLLRNLSMNFKHTVLQSKCITRFVIWTAINCNTGHWIPMTISN